MRQKFASICSVFWWSYQVPIILVNKPFQFISCIRDRLNIQMKNLYCPFILFSHKLLFVIIISLCVFKFVATSAGLNFIIVENSHLPYFMDIWYIWSYCFRLYSVKVSFFSYEDNLAYSKSFLAEKKVYNSLFPWLKSTLKHLLFSLFFNVWIFFTYIDSSIVSFFKNVTTIFSVMCSFTLDKKTPKVFSWLLQNNENNFLYSFQHFQYSNFSIYFFSYAR